MHQITLPISIFPATFCVAVLLFIFWKRKLLIQNSHRLFWFSVTVFLFVYLLVVGYAAVTDVYYQWDLNRYDTDGDGMFGGSEQSPAQRAAMDKLTNDTGRTFSVITGAMLAFVVSLVVYVAGRLFKRNRQ